MSLSKSILTNLAASFVLLSVSAVCHADAYEDGLIAYAIGEYSRAADIFVQAAEQGDVGSIQMLSTMFSEGKGIEKNGSKAYKWTRLAAENGIASAQYALANMLIEGDVVARNDKNDKEAITWFTKAAGNNYYQAYYKLAQMHENGQGVKKDSARAFQLYNIAASEMDVFAQMGDPVAQNNLAMMYEQAQGVVKNYAMALQWYKFAAAQGYAEAQYNIGRMYASGLGVDTNEMEASLWLRLAADQGFVKAQEKLKSGYGSIATASY